MQKTIGIFTLKVKGVKPWDPDSIKSGITGSEEAVIYMSQCLADLGYKVIVFGNPPSGSKHSLPDANPRYVDMGYIYDQILDVAIGWRSPHIGIYLKHIAKKTCLWPHDILHMSVTDEQIKYFDDVLWLSEWQRSQWISISPSFSKFTKIFGNGIVPEQFAPIQQRFNPHSCIYGSNYARDLEIMLDAWPQVKENFPRATLDIYYGWEHWGCLAPDKEKKMRKQVLMLPDVFEHGQVSHEELNKAYQNSSFWTYPCIQAETFCISGLKAQFAGAVPVIIQGAGLIETVRHGFKCNNSKEYLPTLLTAMHEAEKITIEDRQKMREFIAQEFTWKKLAEKWKKLFDTF